MNVLTFQPTMTKDDMLAMLRGEAVRVMRAHRGYRIVFSYWIDDGDEEDAKRVANDLEALFRREKAAEVAVSAHHVPSALTVDEQENDDERRAYRVTYAKRRPLVLHVFPPKPGERNWIVNGQIDGAQTIIGFTATTGYAAFHLLADALATESELEATEWARLSCELERRGAFEDRA